MYNRGPPPSGPRGNSYGNSNNNGYNQFSQATPLGGGRGHAGLGSSSYQPPPQHHQQQQPYPSPYDSQAQTQTTTEVAGGGEKFSLFVGNIADGIENGWLERILQVAGPLASFKRPSPPFAFVEYSDPESVLRCLSVVNGANLKGKTSGVEKSLLVKADEKTRARLDEYEKTRVLSESNSDLTLQAKEDLTSIISRISAGDAIPPSGASLSSAPSSSPHPDSQSDALSEANRLANHLRDLAPEDLPDSQRAVTMSSIAAFRERAAKKQNEKRELDRQIEERRQSMMQNRRNQQNHYGQPPQQAPSNGPGNSYHQGQQQVDPQSFNQNVAFVKENQQNQPEPEIDDAKRERERAEMEHRQQEQMFRERERRFEQRERGRIQAWEREKIRERSIIEQEDRERTFMAERLATWDDDREAERGREPFYIDRIRWRAQRRANRQREEDFDARDRALEQQRLAAVAQHSESFLSQHADLFAESAPPLGEGEQSAGVKLSFGSATAKPKTSEPAPKRSAVLGMGEDEEEGRRKRELIPLNYSDDEDDSKDEKPKVVEKKDEGTKGGGRLSSREKEKQIREIEDGVPRDKDGLFGWKVKWSNLNEDILKRRISLYANKCIVGYLGGEEAELLNAVLEHLRANKPAQELVDELEPVLDDESTDLVVKVWKVLVTETELAHAGF